MAESLPSLQYGHWGDMVDMDDDVWPIPEHLHSIKPFFARAKESFVRKDYDNALRWYGTIEEQTPDSSANNVYALIKSRYMISRCHVEKGNYDEALGIVNNVCDLVISHCPEHIHIPEKLIIKIWERRGNILAAFLLAITFKELRPTNPEAVSLLSDIQTKLEKYLTKEASFVNRTVFDALLLKGKTFYSMPNNLSVAAAYFSKAIEMFQFVFPGDSLQEARDWYNSCRISLMKEHQAFYMQDVDQNSTQHEEDSTVERVATEGLPSPERYLTNQSQLSRNTETPEKVQKSAHLQPVAAQDSASSMTHTSQPSSSSRNKKNSNNNRNNNDRRNNNRRNNNRRNNNSSKNNSNNNSSNNNSNNNSSNNNSSSNPNSSSNNNNSNNSNSSSNNNNSNNINSSSNNSNNSSSNNSNNSSSSSSNNNNSSNNINNGSNNSNNNNNNSSTPSTCTAEGFEDSENMTMQATQNVPGPLKDVKHHELKFKESIPGVVLFSDPENLHVQLAEEDHDTYTHAWEFRARFKAEQVETIPGVYLQYHRHHFYISSIQVVAFDKSNKELFRQTLTIPLQTDHHHPPSLQLDSNTEDIEFQLSVTFQAPSSVTGSFMQRILFDFGKDALLIKEFNIDVGSKNILVKLLEARQAVGLEILPWDKRDAKIIRCRPRRAKERLMSTYSLPEFTEKIVSVQMVDGTIRQDTYKQTMHQLLFAEEIYMRNLLLRLTPTKLKLRALKYLDLGIGGIKYAENGHFFGSIDLDGIEITPDDVAGRVCLRNVRSVLIMPHDNAKCLYEADIKHLQSTKVIVNLTPEICNELKIKHKGSTVDVCIRFHLDRGPHCVMHKAIDSLGPEHVLQLFPDKKSQVDKTKRKRKGMFRSLDPRLNECQKRAIQAIVKVVPPAPPLVVFGPFGTGKTFTLNQAVIYLMRGKTNRVLVCTHTNSAADIHVELLDKHIHGNGGLSLAEMPLRIYSLDREWSKTSNVGRNYALVKDEVFLMPTRENIIDHRVVITTLTTADQLTKLVQQGFFTHILIDEAAQAWETEALIPLALAGPNTKVVFSGDHMQMNPEVYSAFAREKGLQQSLPERLFALYNESNDSSSMDQNVIILLDNYRSNKEILDFPSRYCYKGKIKAKGHADNPSHPEMGSLSFHTAEGREEKQHDNTYLNEAEVYKIVQLVIKLNKSWPECWGEKKLQDIAVVAPYGSQVRAIRSELRKRRLGSVNVETIHNVQGKEFRALFISTVRTRHSIDPSSPRDHHEDLSLQFLSDPKLLITAVTRAKSLVAVVGDPVALCTIGRCRDLWKDYISSCNNLGALCGTTWKVLNREIRDRVKSMALNPEAPLFVPESSNSLSTDVGQETNDNDDSILHLEDDDDDDPNTKEQVDEIIKAFITKCHEREASENAEAQRTKKNNSRLPDLKSLRCKWLIRRKNGREEILLLDMYDKQPVVLNPEEKGKGILDSKELMKKLEEDPKRYLTARLHIGSDRFRTTYAALQDKRKPDIQVKGSIRQAFDGDTVVIDLKPDDLAIEGNVGYFIGVLNQFTDPRKRQYVCEVDPKNPSIMVPIDKSFTKIMNVSHQTYKKIPIYKKDERGELEEVNMLSLQDALDDKCLFVVDFLKWKKGFPLPLGCVVKTIPRGDTLNRSKKVLLTELGIRERFKSNIKGIVQESIPADHQIQSELDKRKRVTNAFTIDPPRARDLDDAISVDDIGDGKFKVGIHIADVSYFVQRGTDLDREAQNRGVSYYPSQDGEENIPMLPRDLSQDLFSLLPNKDRLTVSVFVTLNSEGEVVGREEILRTVTCSRYRLCYSQAQQIIDMEEHADVKRVPGQVRLDIRRLHSLAAKRRWQRLKEASFDHSNNREDTDAHELIEELMILANHTVGDKLHRGNGRGTPFRTQDEPKVDDLNEWASSYGSFAKYCPALKPHLESEDITPDVRRRIELEENQICIKKKVWDQILEAAASEDYEQVIRLICDPFCSPQIATAWQNLMKIQCKAQYQAGVEEPYHHSMKLRSYVHFTSPIRRYIDIEVHRLLMVPIQENGDNGGQQSEDEDEDDMAKLCNTATLVTANSRKFEKESERIYFASKLKQNNLTGMFVIDKIEENAFTIQPVNQEQEQLLGNHKMITFDDLSPSSKSENSNRSPGTTLKWRFRMYLGSDVSRRSYRDFTRSKSNKDDSLRELKEDAETINAMIENKYRFEVQKIEGDTWMKIIDGIKKSAQPLYHVKETDQLRDEDVDHYRNLKSASAETHHQKLAGKDVESKYRFKVHKIERETWMTIIGAIKENESAQLLHHNRKKDQSQDDAYKGRKLKKASKNDEDVGHFFQIIWKLKQYDMICLQLQSRLHRGMIRPDEQFFKVSPHFGVCLEHRKDPRGCFACHATGQVNTKEAYDDIDSYIRRWKPLLEMEAATGAVRQDDGYTLKFLPVSWTRTNDTVKGQFTLTSSYCKLRQTNFHRGDFTCVKISCGSVETCTNSLDNTASTVIWIGHGLIERCEIKEGNAKEKGKDKGKRIVNFKILQMSSEFPRELQDSKRIECDVDIIYQPLPLRRMNEALTVNLENSSDLVQKICLGKKTPKDTFSLPTASDLSLAAQFETSGFQPLNEYQKDGVRKALRKNFSLIQGPPGTGKTVTGIHIAYWFADVNRHVRQRNASEEESEPRFAPPQVLYCGPSNKSVDVVTEYLLRIPEMKDKILRVHGSLIQETEYPIPNKITNSKPNVSEDELKIPEGEVKEVTLHHFIRSESSPKAEKLAEMEAMFAELKERGERVSDTVVEEYCKLIGEAEKWAIQRTGKEIILCTCSRAGSKTITSLCDNIQQCIIDECGMCMEPEVLVPMTSSKAKQFVLIGDHKQLQPIVIDRQAKTFGLQVSMFERLSNRALMLEIQYRMHPSICEFPSDRFYKGKLETPDIVKSRRTADVQIWPAPDLRCAFCHVEGEEKSTVISTAESGVHSKYNEEEAVKAVQVAKYLVDNHGKQIKDNNVVILTPYRYQRKIIQDLLKKAGKDILVTTIIKSQGSEWDYVILSLVRSLPEQELEPQPPSSWLREHLGFVTDDHQINVALTRAKHGLVIIGNKKLLSYSSTWAALIDQYEKKSCVVEGSEWPLPD